LDRCIDFFHEVSGQTTQITDNPQTDIVGVDFLQFAVNELGEKPHEACYFGLRSLPVFSGEGIEGQHFDSIAPAEFHGPANCFGALAVAFLPRQHPAASPSSVAVHDNRYMTGKIS
jgi:hypothetical protein